MNAVGSARARPPCAHALRVLAGYAVRPPDDAALRRAVGGRVVLVTGASEGIGAATARRLGEAGATVLLTARTRDRLEAVRDEIVAAGGRACVHPVDLSRTDDVAALAAAVLAEHGHIDVVVSNAGHSIRRSVAESAGRFHDVERLNAVNHLGPVRLLLDLFPSMREAGRGHVVNVSTTGLGLPTPSWTAYLSSKGAFETWLSTAAPELRADGVTVSTVHLGLVRTRMSAPTALYRKLPAMSADEAADVVCRAVMRRGRWYPWWGRLAVLAATLMPGPAQGLATVGVQAARASEPARVLLGSGLVGSGALPRLAWAALRYGPTPAAVVAAGRADDVALVDADGPVTFGALDTAARAVAGDVRRAGIERGTVVGLVGLTGRSFVAALAGTARAGADAVLLPPDLPADRTAQLLRTARIDAVLQAGPGGSPTLSRTGPPRRSRRSGGRRAPRVVPLTSGTTGAPKPAPRTIRAQALVGPLTTHLARIRLRPGEPVLVAAPLHHGYGLIYLIAGMALRCPVVLGAGLLPEELLAAFARHEVQAAFVLPIQLRRMAEAARDDDDGGVARQELPHLRYVVSGAAALTNSTLADARSLFGEKIFNLFGTTEAAWATMATPADLRAAPGTVGRPPRGVVVQVVDTGGQPLPRGRIGRVVVGGWEPGGRLVPTGDLGHVDVAGRLFLDGRDDELIVSGGENVHPGPVLQAVEAHPDVLDAVVRPVPDAEFGARLAVTACRRRGSAVTAGELREWLRPKLSRAEMPKHIEIVDDLPRTATGKPRRER